MNIALVTGSSGLIGSETVKFLSEKFDKVIGIDNDLRSYFFGDEASTKWNQTRLEEEFSNFSSLSIDIRSFSDLEKLFSDHSSDIKMIVHTAAQPSHDWASKEPLIDFTVNANGTLNLLELTRLHCKEATFIFTSSNKVYGDTPNFLPLVELGTRWEIDENHQYHKNGIDETMSIDHCKHSIFGASKVAADILCQEYGRYFDMNVGVFRGGCLTGPNHSGTQLHGFLAYVMKCAITKDKYTIFGYEGKQVRDNIHSYDLVNMFWHFHQNPKKGIAYNAGGSRHSYCSMKEAITLCEELTGNKMNYTYSETNRIGDHIWYISDLTKFKNDYPDWNWKYDLNDILSQMYDNMSQRY